MNRVANRDADLGLVGLRTACRDMSPRPVGRLRNSEVFDESLLGIILFGAAWAGSTDAGEWRTQSEQPFCLNRDDVLQYLLAMNVEGFKGRAVPGCATLKAGLRVTTVNDEDSERRGRSSGVIKVRVVQGGKVLVGYTLADKE